MATVPFRIVADPVGPQQVEIDGQDITDRVSALRVDASGDHPTVVTLQLRAGAGPLEGAGIVHVLTDGEPVVEFLDRIDPEHLQQAALMHADAATNVVAAVLGVLRQWAEETSS